MYSRCVCSQDTEKGEEEYLAWQEKLCEKDHRGRLQLEKMPAHSAPQAVALCFQASWMRGLCCKLQKTFAMFCNLQLLSHRMTEQVKLEIFPSKTPAQAALARAGCPGLCLDSFRVFLQMDTLQHLWATCYCVWQPSQQKNVSLQSDGIPCV